MVASVQNHKWAQYVKHIAQLLNTCSVLCDMVHGGEVFNLSGMHRPTKRQN